MTTSISITRALAELKTLQKRIEKLSKYSLGLGKFITTVLPGRTPVVSEETIKANWDSVNDLLRRYRTIKFAILQSNAVTKVKIGQKVYTVTEAIAMKDAVKQEQELLDSLRRQKLDVSQDVDRHNHQMQCKLDSLLEINFKERKTSEDDIKSIRDAYLKNNEIRVLDPLKLDTKLAELETHVEEFLTNVDFVLSESNAVTLISV